MFLYIDPSLYYIDVEIMLIGYIGILAHEKKSFLKTQRDHLKNCSDIVVESVSSMRKARSQLLKLIGPHKPLLGHKDTLVVYDVDRIANSIFQLLETVERLKELGVNLLAINNGIDTRKSPAFFSFVETLVKFDHEVHISNQEAGIAVAKLRGGLGGRPTILSEKDRKQARTLFKDTRLSVKEIAKRLNMSTATLYRYFPGGRKNIK